MRIIGSLQHPRLKITVFQMNGRLSVKLESGLYEQTYKFRQGSGVDTLDDLRQCINQEFLDAVEQDLGRMHVRTIRALEIFRKQEGSDEADEFDEIL